MRTGSLIGPALLTAIAVAAPGLAQQATDNSVVGPAQIRDFSLPGSRPAPPREPEPTIAPVEQPKAEPTPAPAPPPAAAEPTQGPAASAQPAAERPRQRRREEREAPLVQSAPAEILDTVREPEQPTSTPAPSGPVVRAPGLPAPAAPAPAAPQATPAAPVQEDGGFPWFWALACLAVAAGAVAFVRHRRAGLTQAAEPELLLEDVAESQPAKPAAAPVRAAVPARPAPPEPAPPGPAPAPSGGVGIVMRPWLEIEFRPERAVATETGAEVRYEVTIRNTGNAPARNVRLAARMFTAGPELDREIAAFFGRGVDDRGAAPLTILPRSDISFQSVVALPREEVKEIRFEGRSLFVPTVAFNLLYDYGRGKTGQTCSSHVVGREAETPAAKMGPFRLDVGPRVWRSVGQRPSALARAV